MIDAVYVPDAERFQEGGAAARAAAEIEEGPFLDRADQVAYRVEADLVCRSPDPERAVKLRVTGRIAVTVSTNLLYNVVSTPGALYRYRRQHQTGGWLALTLVAGTLPGVIAGSVIRVELVPGARVFDLMVSGLLLPLGIWLAAIPPARDRAPDGPARRIPVPVLVALALVTGCAGGIYGIGGGAILSPVLIGSGRPASEVAPATLASTFVTSLGGVLAFTLLSLRHAPVAPNWPTASRWASAASPAATPGPGSSTGFPASLSAASSRPGLRHRGPVPVVRADLNLGRPARVS